MTAVAESIFTPAISRSADHRYSCQVDPSSYADPYPGVTGILSVLDKPALPTWAAKMTAEAAIENMLILPQMLETGGAKAVQAFLTARKNWKLDTARDLGSDVHAMAELVVTGQPTPPMAEATRERVMHYAKWWKASGWTLRLAEAMVVFPTHRYGGTFDLLCYDQDGKTVLADIKTGGKVGRKLYETEVLQLTAYGLAPIVAPMGSEKAYPMPTIDRYAVLHVTTEGVKELEVNVGTREHMAWLACIDLHSWVQSMKGKTF